jgi:hypothetical protein
MGELQQEGFLETRKRRVILKQVDQMASKVDFGPVRLAGLP